MQENENKNPGDLPDMRSEALKKLSEASRKKAYHRRMLILGSIEEKIKKNADTGIYGFTEAERKVLLELRNRIKKKPDF